MSNILFKKPIQYNKIIQEIKYSFTKRKKNVIMLEIDLSFNRYFCT